MCIPFAHETRILAHTVPSEADMPLATRMLSIVLLLSLGSVAPAAAQLAAHWGVVFPTSQTGEAQQHFLEGVTAMHLHMFEDAQEHFRAAQRLAPGFAMAYWGEALSKYRPIWSYYLEDEARAVLRRLGATPAERAAKAPTAREKAYLAAVEALFSEEGTQRDREAAYSAAMKKLAEAYPDDLEAMAWYSLSLWRVTEADLTRAQSRNEMASLALRVLRRNPRHPGANRYLIQSTDDPTRYTIGMVAAENLREVETNSAEAIHIPTHVYTHRGTWKESAEANQRAFDASMAWVKEHGWSLADLDGHNYGHLLIAAHYAYLQSGQLAKAAALRERARSDYEASGKVREIARPFTDLLARWVVELARWQDGRMLADIARRDGIQDAGLWLAVGIAAARANNLDLAREALAALSNGDGGDARLASLSALQVSGLIDLAEGRTERALGQLAEAARSDWEEPLLRIGFPPRPLKPPLELYGEALLEAGQPQKALEQFELGLTVFRRRPLLLLGAARANQKLGRTETAAAYYRELLDVWSGADADHPFVREARTTALR